MVLAIEASKLSLLPLNSSSSSSSFSSPFPPRPSSLIFDPNSLSLALLLADSSISLLSPFSPFSSSSPPSLPPPQTLIPAPSSSACFLRFNLNPNPNSTSLALFVAAGPSHDGSRVLLRFLVRSNEPVGFVPARVGCGQRGLDLDRKSDGVLVDCSHGLKVVLSGSVNYFAMYSASAAKVWVFGVKSVVADRGDVELGGVRVNLSLVKCAVIDCQVPVTSMSVSSGFLIMGELNGVRVFPLRPLVKGSGGRKEMDKKLPLRLGSKENGNLEGAVERKILNLKLPNGLVRGQEGSYDVNKNGLNQAKFKVIAHKNAVEMTKLVQNGVTGARIDGTAASSGHGQAIKFAVDEQVYGDHSFAKAITGFAAITTYLSASRPKSQRLSQDSNKWGASFVPFNSKDEESLAKRSPYMTKKAISIHGFSQNKFLVADSDGNVHILCASVSRPSLMKQLIDIIEVQHIAVLPDSSESSQTVWLSDGYHSVHMLTASDTSTSSNVIKSDSEDLRLSVVQTIFVSENIRDVQPLSPNAILILGQDNLYAYTIS